MVPTQAVLDGSAQNHAVFNALKQFVWLPDSHRWVIFEDEILDPKKPSHLYIRSGRQPRILIKLDTKNYPWEAVGATKIGQILAVNIFDIYQHGPVLATIDPANGNATLLRTRWPPGTDLKSAQAHGATPEYALSPRGDRIACTTMTRFGDVLSLIGLEPRRPYCVYVGDASGNHWQLAATFDKPADNARWLPDGKHLSVRLTSGSFAAHNRRDDLAVISVP